MRYVDRFLPGQPVGGPNGIRHRLNIMADEIRKTSGPVGPASVPQNAFPIFQVEIKTLETDELTCVDVGAGSDMDAEEFKVSLPETFTETSRDGVNYTYTDINTRVADGTENQELTPKYIVGDKIYITWTEVGDNGWLDINVDGRQWAKV